MVAPGEGGPVGPNSCSIVDPIDGTRPGARGPRGRLHERRARPARRRRADDGRRRRRLRGRDQERRVVRRASAGSGCRASRPIALSENTDLERLFWVYGFTRRPARAVVEVIGELIDLSSLGGGVFDLGSATFNLTRDPHRPARRLRRAGRADGRRDTGDAPGVRARRRRLGRQQLALRPRGGGAVPVGGRRRDHRRRGRAARSRTGCSAPTPTSTSPASRRPRPRCTRSFSTPWNGAWSACARRISWPRLNPTRKVRRSASARRAGPQEPGGLHPYRRPARSWRRSASSPSRSRASGSCSSAPPRSAAACPRSSTR